MLTRLLLCWHMSQPFTACPHSVFHWISKWRKGKRKVCFQCISIKGHAFSLNSFIKPEGGKKRRFKASFHLWESFPTLLVGAPLCLLPSFVFWGIWGCLIHNSCASSKEVLWLCVLGSKHVVSLYLCPSEQTCTHAHTLNSMGGCFFPAVCMVWGDEST